MMFHEHEQVRHLDGRLGVVERIYTALHHDENVLVKWRDGSEQIVRSSQLRHHHEVCDATNDDIHEIEQRYDMSIEELVAEAEAGYNVDRIRTHQR